MKLNIQQIQKSCYFELENKLKKKGIQQVTPTNTKIMLLKKKNLFFFFFFFGESTNQSHGLQISFGITFQIFIFPNQGHM